MERRFDQRGDSRALAPVVAYVLLIAMGLTAAGVVFTGLQESVRVDEVIACPDAVDISIKKYSCTLDGSFCLELDNKGRFSADGFEVRVDNKTPRSFDLFEIDSHGSFLNPGHMNTVSYPFPIQSPVGNVTTVSYVEVQPYRIIDGERHLCDSILSQEVLCEPTGPDCATFCVNDSQCSGCGVFGPSYCGSDGNVYHNQTCTAGTCTLGVCSSSQFVNETLVEDCVSGGLSCVDGACVAVESPWKADIFIIMDDTVLLDYDTLWGHIEGLSSWISADLYSWSLPDSENARVGYIDMFDVPNIYDYNSTGTAEQPEWPNSSSGYYRGYFDGFNNYSGNPSRIGMMGPSFNPPLVGPYWNVIYGAWKYMDGWPFVNGGSGQRNIRDGIDIARLELGNASGFDRHDSEYPDYIFIISTGLPRRTALGIYDTDTCADVNWASPNNYSCHIAEATEAADRAKAEGITIYTFALSELAEDLDTTTSLQEQRDNLSRFLEFNISSGPGYAFENSTSSSRGNHLWYMLDQVRHNPVTHV